MAAQRLLNGDKQTIINLMPLFNDSRFGVKRIKGWCLKVLTEGLAMVEVRILFLNLKIHTKKDAFFAKAPIKSLKSFEPLSLVAFAEQKRDSRLDTTLNQISHFKVSTKATSI